MTDKKKDVDGWAVIDQYQEKEATLKELKDFVVTCCQSLDRLEKRMQNVETLLKECLKPEPTPKEPILLPYIQYNDPRREFNRLIRTHVNVPFMAEHTKEYKEFR